MGYDCASYNQTLYPIPSFFFFLGMLVESMRVSSENTSVFILWICFQETENYQVVYGPVIQSHGAFSKNCFGT